ncbi:MAG: NAD(P)-dependent oxidoreductase [Myxococcota bacterium]
MRISFIGLGVMGFPMAGHLAAAGHQLTVYNRTRARAEQWATRYPGHVAATPAEAAEGAQLVMSCVGADHDVLDVAEGETGLLSRLKSESVWIDHTTASAKLARTMDEAVRAIGAHFIDAPVSGGQSGAELGALTIMCGSDEASFERVDPVLACYGKKRVRIGEVGSGQLAKMVNQICIAGLLQGLSEGVHFAEQAGLDHDRVFEAIAEGAAGSWQMRNRADTMHARKFDYGFALDWMRKDLGLALDEARRNRAELPVTALVDQYYGALQRRGRGRDDSSTLIALLDATKPDPNP